jgi:endonuclease IV
LAECRKNVKSLINDLMNEAQIDLKYYIDDVLQNSQATFQKLDEIQKKIENLEKIASNF